MAITDFSATKSATNGQPAIQPPAEETEKRRGRPPLTEGERKAAKDKELSTESILDLKKEIESQIAAAKEDFESLGLLADIQLSVLALETMLINRRKGKRPA